MLGNIDARRCGTGGGGPPGACEPGRLPRPGLTDRCPVVAGASDVAPLLSRRVRCGEELDAEEYEGGGAFGLSELLVVVLVLAGETFVVTAALGGV